MKPNRVIRDILLAAIGFTFAFCAQTSSAQSAVEEPGTNEVRIIELHGQVQVSPRGAATWVLTQTNQVLHPFDRLRTLTESRVALKWSDNSVVSFGPSTELEILPPHQSDAQSGLNIIKGIFSFFHRDKPGRIRIITRGAVAGIEGTEFVVAVAPVEGTERTTLSVIDGRVRFGNEQATLILTNGQQAVAEPGKAPVRTAGFEVNSVLQWFFYYPAVLDLTELPLTPEEQGTLRESLAAYRSGDLLGALAKYPDGRQPGSDAERVYYAALVLSVGEVEKAGATLDPISTADTAERPRRLAGALRRLIAAVKQQPAPSTAAPQTATEFLAASYYDQAHARGDESLQAALRQARAATELSPGFGFAWARVAELEFSFGRADHAIDALEKSLVLTPRNAQALALKGFLLAGQNRTREAIDWFNRAIAADSALGNAWLGRGLCRFRLGDMRGGREDLLVAAALEPRRAELRSYLGKAYGETGDFPQAAKELQLARTLDPHDPTTWLYSALLNQQHNRINEAIADLEKSQELNSNRSVYRSQLLLDQDHAVRSANLASVYQDAGMTDVAAREAVRAVNYDYANYSAHLFLANSYVGLSDPNLINLRYETPVLNEYLLANLLAPVNAGPISPQVSQQEYSRLFERHRFGVVSDTEYLSRGAWTQSGAQFGVFENFSYSVEAFYRTDPGQRVNNDLEQRQLALALKYQLTPRDSAYFLVRHYEAESGHLGQLYDPATANPGVRVEERQEPIIGLGYHHEWNPGVHTLFFAARLDDALSVTNPFGPTLLANRPDGISGSPELIALYNVTTRQHIVNELEIYSGELQQIWQQPAHLTVLGARVQYGTIETENQQIDVPFPYSGFFPAPPEYAAQQDVSSIFRRFSVYGYHQWELLDSLQLIAGVSYDRVTFPKNFQTAPVSDEEITRDQVSPKAGVIWNPAAGTTVRFAYAQALSGASFEQSFQLEPSQVAGFVQSFRSLIPETVVGPTAGARLEVFGLSLEQKLPTRTYLGLSGDLLYSDLRRTVGAFDALDAFLYAVPSELRQQLDYEEQSLLFTIHQLLGKEWAAGARYRISRAILKTDFVDVPDGLPFNDPNSPEARERLEGILHQVNLHAIYNHRCGFFAEGQALWYYQDNDGYTPSLAGDDFWQFNAFAGYRFARRKAEIAAGVLNIADQDYRLNPLNLHNDLPRERTLAVRLRLNF